ncbi:MAG: hypothetical protein NVS3B20_08310 [Polyangiales bacterium]
MKEMSASLNTPTSVIVLDDDPDLRALLRELLQEEGFSVTLAATVEEARVALRAPTEAVFLLDLTLEGEDGRCLLRELAAQQSAPPTVIVSSCHDSAWLAAEFGVLVLSKPFRAEQLIAQISRARTEHRRPRFFDGDAAHGGEVAASPAKSGTRPAVRNAEISKEETVEPNRYASAAKGRSRG